MHIYHKTPNQHFSQGIKLVFTQTTMYASALGIRAEDLPTRRRVFCTARNWSHLVAADGVCIVGERNCQDERFPQDEDLWGRQV